MREVRPTTAAAVRSPARTRARTTPRRRARTPSRIATRSGTHRPDTAGTQSGGKRRKRILVALTGTIESQSALKQAFALARDMDAYIVGLVIGPRLPMAPTTVGEVDDAQQQGIRLFDSIKTPALQQAAAHGVDLDMRFHHGPFVRTLVRETEDGTFDLVVIGGKPRPSRWLTALRASLLIRRLSSPLLIAS